MKALVITLVAACFAIVSCKKDTDFNSMVSGSYQGSFKRNIYSTTANVTLTLSTNKFSGDTDTSWYPIICTGNFSATANTISFTPVCMLPFVPDGTLVLSGSYDYTLSADSLYITRYYQGIAGINDVYKLKRQ